MITSYYKYNAYEVKSKMSKKLEKATFAGGCFWCMVKPFDEWDGIHQVISGYTGGHLENPTYEDVKAGHSGHYEAVEITFKDRKSTRLNSSHVAISYAVFCLKKKKKK